MELDLLEKVYEQIIILNYEINQTEVIYKKYDLDEYQYIKKLADEKNILEKKRDLLNSEYWRKPMPTHIQRRV